MGIFAGPGVGKSILLGMIARYTSADVIVIALVGERGREVRDFLERDLTDEGRKRAVVVVSTSDQAPVLRVRATLAATSVAEYFRDQGKKVLLLVDSITRLAMAQRQIGLAAGEPPATKGYTPSVFALLPKLLERAGQSEQGSITGFYTVLVEGDDMTEPVSDAVRGILDGHLALSRDLANKGHYPAISVLESVSRVMPDVIDSPHMTAARKVRRLISIYHDVEDLVNIGAYVPGSNPEIDLAVRAHPLIDKFLRQEVRDHLDFPLAKKLLFELGARIDQEGQSLQGNSKNSPAMQPA
jgi:FliI/YscN family ATPase